jgi:nitrogen regulatory protein P-II 1
MTPSCRPATVYSQEEEPPMKKIEAIIDPEILTEVRQALTRAHMWDVIVSDVRCTDPHGPHTEFYRGLEYRVAFIPKVKLELVIDDCDVDWIAETISETVALHGGAGRLFVSAIESVDIPSRVEPRR